MSVTTVLGPVLSEKLGVTLTHEHICLKFDDFYTPPPQIFKDKFDSGITLDNIGYVRQFPYSSRLNLDFSDEGVVSGAIEEVRLFADGGGGTIVENSSLGLGRNLKLMRQVSRATQVNIIAGTGHYVALVQAEGTLHQTVEQLAELMRKELTEGCDEDAGIKCGFIGEVGSSWPIHEFERRCIIATGEVQSELKCPVSFHPGRDQKAPEEIIRLYAEAGGDISRAVMSHMDRTFSSTEGDLEFSDLGSYCQFDLFGNEVSYYQLAPELNMPSDAQRISRIQSLIANGKEERVLVSHDIHTKHRLVKYGGHGYAHIPVVVRNQMSQKGISEGDIKRILINNPAVWLTGKNDA